MNSVPVHRIMVGAAVACALSAAAWLYFNDNGARNEPGQSSQVSPPPPAAPAPAKTPGLERQGRQGSAPADRVPDPPWLPKDAVPGGPAASAAATPAAGTVLSEEKKSRLEAALKRLQQLQSAGVTDPKQVSDVLLEVERANGSPVLQGLRLDLLRENLQVAEKMKVLAEELNTLQQSPKAGASTEANGAMRAKLDAKLAQLEVLQKQLRTDIMQPGEAPK